jgi:hypothetical protein
MNNIEHFLQLTKESFVISLKKTRETTIRILLLMLDENELLAHDRIV